MRKHFEQVIELDILPISEVEIDSRSRHELPKLLAGLKFIFVTPELNEQIFEILDEKINFGKKDTGRPGMNIWEILVLGTMRLNLDIDYDHLHDLANNHMTVRGILGVHKQKVFYGGRQYSLQTIKDNICLLDEQTLQRISEVVVKAGHQLKKKKKTSKPLS